ncbi:cytochrome b5 domain-containing protein [Candidatus Roizmanbacteria bacterium]|nr:cytochrome b5 domain-containing protein [Candidatus Roizmanbacteria bacterium]
MKIALVVVALIIVAALGYSVLNKKTESSKPTPKVSNIAPPVSPSVDQERAITLTEIASHNSATDCWFAVDGNVYDVSAFIGSQKHPGGKAILLGCGKDATELYNTKPGTGKPHSERAHAYLQTFKIGTLKKE